MSDMSDKKLQLYNIIVSALVGCFISRVYNGNMLVLMILIVAVLLFLFKIVKIEKYIKKYLIK